MNGKISVALAGCGGTGSQVLVTLARLDTALRGLGGDGLKVDIFDPDKVSEANAGRQSFYDCDIGRNKAEVLVNRLRMCFPGFEAKAHPVKFDQIFDFSILITCVDSRRLLTIVLHIQSYHAASGTAGTRHGRCTISRSNRS